MRIRCKPLVVALSLALSGFAIAEDVTVLHIGDQESWLISAQGNLRDTGAQAISFYGGADRLATVIANARTAATAAGRSVITLNAGDSFLPGPRLNASFANLANAHADGGQDFYDAIASRAIGFDATVFGNHEFDLDNTGPVAARFAEVSGSTYLSVNLDFNATPELSALATAGKVAGSKVLTTNGGRKVGIVGATTPLLPSISSPPTGIMKVWNPAATSEQNLQAIVPLIQAEIDDLRNNQGVGAVILLSHLQNAQNEIGAIVPALTGVDLVVSGGGHELMTDPDDLLINGGVARTFTTHPVYATAADGKSVPVVTGHFGNRYVGELTLTLDDTTGAVTAIAATRMIRVSGAAADADKVAGDPAVFADAVQPVMTYIAALNAQIIGQTAVALNGPTHTTCSPTPCTFTEGVRNAETGLGNLVADAMRFAGKAEVAIQNGGGIRTNIATPGDVSVGDTFNILPFTNLVKRAASMNATQLKALLEHSVATASPGGAANGRFAQVSGIKAVYDSSRAANDRVRRLELDDGTLLVDNGAVVNSARNFSFATIDFTANGGDGYPFAALGVVFENNPFSITYQEALANYIQAPKADGGLGRSATADGPAITANMYGEENAFELHGRLIDAAVGVAVPGTTRTGTARRDVLTGTAGDDVIHASVGSDTLTGGAGGDRFIYSSLREAGDVITDFTPYADKLAIDALLASLGIAKANAIANGHVRVVDVTGGASIQIDSDGFGPAAARPLVTLRGLTARQIVPARDLGL
ncbi:MAG: alkaline phosphatase [Betaproteobacteria bacterium HGW-Betaproteobacteria-7]|jgi:2',3'-cyclic-nucleotide 2'-phosphodiesterase (5'-nucleotidase family)|nr:MAG: alkaline phosphatase [Betaproteobacteria bacterium HGW-Betaproteobacteria-7]